jgi:hypothetical protein
VAHAQVEGQSSVGYIDTAIPMNQIRLRFEAGYDYPFPDRGGFTYSRSSIAGGQSAEPRASYQEVSAYAEFCPMANLSVFAEVPVRAINPTDDPDATGVGDISGGVKYAFFTDEDALLTAQLRVYAPTGDSGLHLGSGHASIEPALLAWSRLAEGFFGEGELRLWIPVGGGDQSYNSHVVRYGIGTSYAVWEKDGLTVLPVLEFVGWTFLDGQKHVNTPDGMGTTVGAGGDTIVNAKLGVRFRTEMGDFYVGYGRALTGEPFYKDVLRAEYRFRW